MLVIKGRSKQVSTSSTNKTGKVVIGDKKKVDVLNNYFASAFKGNLSSRWNTKQELEGKIAHTI